MKFANDRPDTDPEKTAGSAKRSLPTPDVERSRRPSLKAAA